MDTKEKIIEVASYLFFTKGYESTKISEIIDSLDGLTKGAVYHHFKSKEDIFNAVVERIGLRNKFLFDAIKDDETLNGISKLRKIVELSFNNENMEVILQMSPNLLESPKLFASFMKQMESLTYSEYILPIVREAVKDGSIKSDYPDEVAGLITILFNLWLNPLVYKMEEREMYKKILVLNELFEHMEIQLFNINQIENIKRKLIQ